MEESQVEKFNIKQMKDLFEQKAAQLATEIVGTCLLLFIVQFDSCFCLNLVKTSCVIFFQSDLKAKYDAEKSLREAAEHRLANLTQELQKERGVCEDLKTELVTLGI